MRNRALITINYYATGAILWSYMFSVYVYKIWYIVTAISLFIAVISTSVGSIRANRLIWAMLLLVPYFSYILLSALWAIDPLQTIKYFLVDFIELIVFALFYLLAINNPPERIVRLFICLVVPGTISAVMFYFMDPNAIRIGQRSVTILPMALPFIIMHYTTSNNATRYLALLSSVAILALIFVSMSRTPLAVGLILSILSLVIFIKLSLRHFVRLLSAGVITAVSALIMWHVDITRVALIKMYVRVFHRNVALDGLVLSAEPVDKGRELISRGVGEVMFEYQPLGMGYMNFPIWSGEFMGKSKSLHNIYQAWWVEGGVVLSLIVSFIFIGYFFMLKKSISIAKYPYYKSVCIAAMVSMVGVLLFGIFHQMHQSPAMFALLGIGYALYEKRKAYV